MYAPPPHAPPDIHPTAGPRPSISSAGSDHLAHDDRAEHRGMEISRGGGSTSTSTSNSSSRHDRPYSNPYGPWPYAPTTEPTPGQPLLSHGKMLVYPHDWPGCPKCQNTGYKYGDPSNPCQKCWSKFGQKPNAILIASAGMRGAKILQRPLHAPGLHAGPMASTSTGSVGGGYGFGAGQHGHSQMQPTGQPMHWGPTFLPPQHSGMSGYAPPVHAPPQHAPLQARPPPRPNVHRENNEEDLNEEGEAPPAYEDAVAAGPDGALPPQRRGNGENAGASQSAEPSTSHGGRHSPSSMMSTMHVGPTPLNNTSVMLPTSPGGSVHPPPTTHAWPQHQPQFEPHHSPFPGAWTGPAGPSPLPFTVLHAGAMPPPNAIPVAPGDPRIGGRLCYKCGGSGVRDTMWLTEETCNRCNGIGRLLI